MSRNGRSPLARLSFTFRMTRITGATSLIRNERLWTDYVTTAFLVCRRLLWGRLLLRGSEKRLGSSLVSVLGSRNDASRTTDARHCGATCVTDQLCVCLLQKVSNSPSYLTRLGTPPLRDHGLRCLVGYYHESGPSSHHLWLGFLVTT